MINIFFCLLLFVTFFSGSNNTMISKSELVTNSIVKKFVVEKQKIGLFAIGLGGSEKDEKAETIMISFDIEKKLDIESARKLIVETTNDFLSLINTRENIEQYLVEYPFTIRNLSFAIFSERTKRTPTSNLCIVSSNYGRINYYINPGESEPLTTVHSETFEEAKRILAEQKS